MSKPKVFISREIPKKAINMIANVYDVVIWKKMQPPSPDEYKERVKDADALVSLLSDKIDSSFLDVAKNLRIIAQYAVGYDNIDIAECTKRGIYVTNTPGVLSESVADLTIGLILAITRRIVEGDKFIRSGEWEKLGVAWHPNLLVGMDLKGKTLGIIGMGSIGYEVAKRAKAFGMKIIYYSRRMKENVEKELDAKFFELEDLLRNSDIVSIHTPLTKETYHLLGEKEIKMMKSTAYLINTARGAIVDEEILYKALKERWIAGAALDVFSKEPYPKNSKLLELENLVVTPHIGSAGKETRENMGLLVAKNLIEFAKGNVPPNLVNKEVINVRKPGF
ncbi:MAG: glyoxylate reductase [Candidatus Asgardarchaeia archaeon]